MVVQELQSCPEVTPPWTGVCPVGHGLGEIRAGRPGVLAPAARQAPVGPRKRPPARSGSGLARVPRSAGRVRPVTSAPGAPVRAVPVRAAGRAPGAPGTRVLIRATPAARACRVVAPPRAGVVDDVPTWVLVSCGMIVGVLMLLALAVLGGPAYA